jgi:hypothetical protein
MKQIDDGRGAGIFTDRMHMELLYYAAPDDAPQAAEANGTAAG